MGQRDKYSLSAFEESLLATLKYFDAPEKMGEASTLATPYFLSHVLSADNTRGDAAVLGETLREQILLAAAELWGGPLPTTYSLMRTALLEERKQKGTRRYSYLLLELRHFRQFFRPKSIRDIYENPDYLLDSKSGDHRSYRVAIKHLGEVLLGSLQPTLKLEQPPVPSGLVGYKKQIEGCLPKIDERATISISGASGTGKSSLGAAIASQVSTRSVFWYTVRPTFNDHIGSMLFMIGYFLHVSGASNVWRLLLSSSGQIPEPEIALGLIRQDLDELGEHSPLICIDEVDLLDGSDLDPAAEPHRQLLEFIRALRGTTPILLIGQRTVAESDHHVMLAGLSVTQIQQVLAQNASSATADAALGAIPASAAKANSKGLDSISAEGMAAKLYRYTHGNPRLLHLCLALHGAGSVNESILESLPLSPGFLPLLKKLWSYLSPAERQTLQQLSVFRSPAPADQWAHAAALLRLQNIRLLSHTNQGAVELVPALRAGIYNLLTQDQKEQFHSEAAFVRQQRGEYTAAAYHYLQANRPAQAIHVWYPHQKLEIQRGHATAASTIFQKLSQKELSENERQALAVIRGELHRLLGTVSEGLVDLVDANFGEKSELSIRVLGLKGEFLEAVGHTEESLQTYGEAKQTALQLLSHLAMLSYQRGMLFLRQRDLGPSQDEAAVIEHALQTLRGLNFEEEGRYHETQDAYQQALSLAESLQDVQLIALACNNLAALFGRHQDYERAIDYAQKAMRCYEQVGDRWNQEKMRTNMAFICIQTGHIQEAIEHGAQALRYFEYTQIGHHIATSAVNLADAYMELGDLHQAQFYAEKTLDQEDRKTQPYAHFNLGRIALTNENSTKAQAYLLETIVGAQNNQDTYLEAYAHREISQVYLALGQRDEKEKALEKALQLFQSLEMNEEISATQALIDGKTNSV